MHLIKSIFVCLFLISNLAQSQIDSASVSIKETGIEPLKPILINQSLLDSLPVVQDKKSRLKPFIIPTALFTASIISWKSGFDDKVKEYRDDHHMDFNNKIDDQTQFATLGLAYLLPAFGLKPKNDIWNRTVLTAKSIVITLGITYSLKNGINRERPSGIDHAFPSGHTTFAFMGAEILHQEYKDTKPWVSYLGYGLASQVAIFRVLNNQHWLGDVLAAGAVGIAGTKLAYFTHKFKWGRWFKFKNNNITLIPDFYNQGLYLSLRF